MAHSLTVKIEDEKLWKTLVARAEDGVRVGRGDAEEVTPAEMAVRMIATGLKRRAAANKWARANAKDPKAKKTPTNKYKKVKREGAVKVKKTKAPAAKKSAPKKSAPKKAKAAVKLALVKKAPAKKSAPKATKKPSAAKKAAPAPAVKAEAKAPETKPEAAPVASASLD